MESVSDTAQKFEEWAKAQVSDYPLSLKPCHNKSCGRWFHYFAPDTAWAFSAFEAGRSLGLRDAAQLIRKTSANHTEGIQLAYAIRKLADSKGESKGGK